MSGLINSAGSKSGVIGTTELDYEEGEWTGVVTDGTNNMTMNGSWTTGFYTKIGNIVTVSGQFITTAVGSASGGIRLAGLPFTSFNNGSVHGGTTAGYASGLNITAGHTVGFYIGPNSTSINFHVWDATTGTTSMTAAEWTADGAIIFEFSYRAA